MTDVTGVAAPRLNGNRLVLLPRCLKIWGIATPACALVRNDRAFSNSPFAFYHGVDLAVYFQTPYIIPRTTSPYRMKLWGFLRFERDAHKPFSICGYSFQNGLGFQRDGNSFGSGFPIGARAPCWQGNPKGTAFPWQWFPKGTAFPWRWFSKAAELPWQEESNETGGFVAHDFARKVKCVIPLATVGGGKGLFGAGTSTFRQPQNRRILARHALKFRICPLQNPPVRV